MHTCATEHSQACRDAIQYQVDSLLTIPKFFVDDVAKMYAENDKDVWNLKTDIPNMSPPFREFWVEWNEPTVWREKGKLTTVESVFLQQGVFVRSYDLKTNILEYLLWKEWLTGDYWEDKIQRNEDMLRQSCRAIETNLWASSGIQPVCGKPVFLGVTHLTFIRADGSVVDNMMLTEPGVSLQMKKNISPLHILGLAISFTHCKNVRVVETPDDRGEKWHRRTNTPILKFHTIDINPMKQTLRTEGRSDETGIKKALHICRGHFVTYTPEHPLFGKYVGTFWKPDHVRGNAKNGIVLKDYKVNFNTGETS